MRLKQDLLTSPFGRAALQIRDKLELLKTAHATPEAVGTVANDLMATMLITRLCASNRTFVDVGAHIGSIIAQVRRGDPSIKIAAIEAIPGKAADLRRRFPYAEVHERAVGDHTGTVSFYIDTEQSGYSSLGKPTDTQRKSRIEITVPIDRLDNLVTAGDVDAIKIDVEGAELGVLRGAVRILKSCRPIVMFESGPAQDDGLGYTKDGLFQHLSSLEFSLVVPNRVAHLDDGLTLAGFIESHLYPRRTTNYFAIPRERRAEFRDRARRTLGL
ncbi:MAG TPA: FkbM family methyltransferase [Steroidobacteraceae bacterium]|nr:FkbM family methyltransferase [Steroidobacteraceae bacterium]